MKSKKQILEELAIDRTQTDDVRHPLSKLLVGLLLLIGLTLSVFLVTPSLFSSAKSVDETVNTQFKQKEAASENTPANQLAKLSIPSNNNILDVSGFITARRIATVSAKSFGLITSVAVEEGTVIEKNQIIAQLDSSDTEIDLQLAKSAYDLQKSAISKIEIELAEKNRVLKRKQKLFAVQFSNEAEISEIKSEISILKVALESAKTNLQMKSLQVAQIEQQLDDLTIRAPFSGVVTVKNAQPGEIISPSAAGGGYTRTGICTIVDMDSLEIEVDINESFINKIFEGQAIKATLYAYEDWSFGGTVEKIIPTVDRAKATIRVRIKIIDKDQRILPNMAVKVSFLDVGKKLS